MSDPDGKDERREWLILPTHYPYTAHEESEVRMVYDRRDRHERVAYNRMMKVIIHCNGVRRCRKGI